MLAIKNEVDAIMRRLSILDTVSRYAEIDRTPVGPATAEVMNIVTRAL
jgi:hypothetical protein